MFKQAATEPWMANWRRLRTISIHVTEHLVLLSFNTSYTVKINMADIHKQAEEWLKAHPKATPKEIWLAGYWQSTDNWCNAKR